MLTTSTWEPLLENFNCLVQEPHCLILDVFQYSENVIFYTLADILGSEIPMEIFLYSLSLTGQVRFIQILFLKHKV